MDEEKMSSHFWSKLCFVKGKSDKIQKETNLKKKKKISQPFCIWTTWMLKCQNGSQLALFTSCVLVRWPGLVVPCRCNPLWLKFVACQWRRPPSNTFFFISFFLAMKWSKDNFPAERWSTWTARARCQLHVISIKCGWALSIKKTQGNLWLLKEIPLARSQPERRPFVPRHVSHTFRVQISSGFMKPRFIFAHCNVSVGSGKYGEALSAKS